MNTIFKREELICLGFAPLLESQEEVCLLGWI